MKRILSFLKGSGHHLNRFIFAIIIIWIIKVSAVPFTAECTLLELKTKRAIGTFYLEAPFPSGPSTDFSLKSASVGLIRRIENISWLKGIREIAVDYEICERREICGLEIGGELRNGFRLTMVTRFNQSNYGLFLSQSPNTTKILPYWLTCTPTHSTAI